MIFNQRIYQLTYPNLEIRTALNENIFKYLLIDSSIPKIPILTAILNKDMEQFKK